MPVLLAWGSGQSNASQLEEDRHKAPASTQLHPLSLQDAGSVPDSFQAAMHRAPGTRRFQKVSGREGGPAGGPVAGRALAPAEDELGAKLRLFEAVGRLMSALAQRAPLVVLLEDLHWVDSASLDLVRYLGHSWKDHGSRVLLLGTMRREEVEPMSQLSAELCGLGRDLPLTQLPLPPLSQAETLQLLETLVGERTLGARSDGKQCAHIPARPSTTGPGVSTAPERETPLVALGDFLFAHTGGQPLYLLETLKLLREREWLVPRLGADDTWRLELAVEMATIVAQEPSPRELLPPSVRATIQARLAKLSPSARQLVMASAVLGQEASAKRLWQVADVGMQAGVEALEEAVGSGILREEQAGGPGAGQAGSYRFVHELVESQKVVPTPLRASLTKSCLP